MVAQLPRAAMRSGPALLHRSWLFRLRGRALAFGKDAAVFDWPWLFRLFQPRQLLLEAVQVPAVLLASFDRLVLDHQL